MPELPDITVYVEALNARVRDGTLEEVRLNTPFLLRTVEPPLAAVAGKRVSAVARLGKRIVFELEGELFIVLHLMIAGRLHWFAAGAKRGRKADLASFEFSTGTLTLTEAGSKRRASIHLLHGQSALLDFDRGGIEVFEATREEFAERLRSENHTVKRSLTDPRLFSGIGNAYSDEILHRAQLSPVALTQRLEEPAARRLYEAVQNVLRDWTTRLQAQAGAEFPEKVSAFRPEMAVHGRFGKPCPVCGTAVQRIRYAENETNYCPRCQTGGRVLADRSLSRLLKDDWPRTIEELEAGKA